MAFQCLPNKVYHCQSPQIGSGMIQVVDGTVKLVGSNVTEYEPQTNKLIVPAFNDLIETGDELSEGFHQLAGLPEWFGFTGSGTVWVKMCVDPRIEPGD